MCLWCVIVFLSCSAPYCHVFGFCVLYITKEIFLSECCFLTPNCLNSRFNILLLIKTLNFRVRSVVRNVTPELSPLGLNMHCNSTLFETTVC